MGIVSETKERTTTQVESHGWASTPDVCRRILAPNVRALHVVVSGPIDKGSQAESGLVWSAIASKPNLKHHSPPFHSLGCSSQRTRLSHSPPVDNEPSQLSRHLRCLARRTSRVCRCGCDASAKLAAEVRLSDAVSRLAACVFAAGGSMAGALMLGVHRPSASA